MHHVYKEKKDIAFKQYLLCINVYRTKYHPNSKVLAGLTYRRQKMETGRSFACRERKVHVIQKTAVKSGYVSFQRVRLRIGNQWQPMLAVHKCRDFSVSSVFVGAARNGISFAYERSDDASSSAGHLYARPEIENSIRHALTLHFHFYARWTF